MSHYKNINDSNSIVLIAFINEVLQSDGRSELMEGLPLVKGFTYLGILGGSVWLFDSQALTQDMSWQFVRDVLADISLDFSTVLGYSFLKTGRHPKKALGWLGMSAIAHLVYYGDVANNLGLSFLDREESDFLAVAFGLFPAIGAVSAFDALRSPAKGRAIAAAAEGISPKGQELLDTVRGMSIDDLTKNDILLRIILASETDPRVCYMLLRELGGGEKGSIKAGAKKFKAALDKRSIDGLEGIDSLRRTSRILDNNKIKTVINAQWGAIDGAGRELDIRFFDEMGIGEMRNIDAKRKGRLGKMSVERLNESEYSLFWSTDDAFGQSADLGKIDMKDFITHTDNFDQAEDISQIASAGTSRKLTDRVYKSAKNTDLFRTRDHWLSKWAKKIDWLTSKSQGLGLSADDVGSMAKMDLGIHGKDVSSTIMKVDDVYFYTYHQVGVGGIDTINTLRVGDDLTSSTILNGWARALRKSKMNIDVADAGSVFSGTVVTGRPGENWVRWRKTGDEGGTVWAEFLKFPATEKASIISKTLNRSYEALLADEYNQGIDITYESVVIK